MTFQGAININNKGFLTPEGGFSVFMINKTSSYTVKGYCVEAHTGTDNAFQYCSTGSPMCIGVIYDGGIDTGEYCRVVVAGIADVFMGNTAVRGGIVCSNNSGFSVLTGQASCQSNWATPHLTAHHWYEIGHVFENKNTGLAKCVLHFN